MSPVHDVGSAAALLLAGCFAWAAIAKAVRPAAAVAAFARLRVPAPTLAVRATVLLEALLAAALLLHPGAGAAGALAALAAFSALLVRARRNGVSHGCACFGPGGEGLLSTALLRNVMLVLFALPALAVHAAPRPSLAALVAASALAIVGGLGLALWDLRARTGRLWDNRVVLSAVQAMEEGP